MGKARTVLEAGFALKTQGSFVKGFTPLRAGVAGFFFSFRFKAPAILKEPDFFSSSAATATRPSMQAFTSFAFKPVVSATALYAPEAVMLPLAFMAFIAFIAFMGAMSGEKFEMEAAGTERARALLERGVGEA
jgi:hypothetical protein